MKRIIYFLSVISVLLSLISCSNITKSADRETKRVPVAVLINSHKTVESIATRGIAPEPITEYFEDTTILSPDDLVTYDETAQTWNYEQVLSVDKIVFKTGSNVLATWESDPGANAYHWNDVVPVDPICAYEKAIRYSKETDASKLVMLEEGFYSFELDLLRNNNLLAVAYVDQYLSTYSYDKGLYSQNRFWVNFTTQAPDVGIGNIEIEINWDTTECTDVNTIKAGIYRKTNAAKPLPGYELEPLTINKSTSTYKAVYAKNGVTAGVYWLKYCTYDSRNNLTATYLKELVIETERDTKGVATFSVVNKIFTITYDMNIPAGETDTVMINEGFVPVTQHNQGTAVALPGKDDYLRAEHVLVGWCTEAQCTTEPMTQLSYGVEENITLYAKWQKKIIYRKGDIVFEDGSVKDAASLDLTTDKPIAVIFKEATPYEPALGVSLTQCPGSVYLMRDLDVTFSINTVKDNICNVIFNEIDEADNTATYSFEGDLRGNDNYYHIKLFHINKNILLNKYYNKYTFSKYNMYPVEEWAERYGRDNMIDEESECYSGWFVPSVYELYLFVSAMMEDDEFKSSFDAATNNTFILRGSYWSSSGTDIKYDAITDNSTPPVTTNYYSYMNVINVTENGYSFGYENKTGTEVETVSTSHEYNQLTSPCKAVAVHYFGDVNTKYVETNANVSAKIKNSRELKLDYSVTEENEIIIIAEEGYSNYKFYCGDVDITSYAEGNTLTLDSDSQTLLSAQTALNTFSVIAENESGFIFGGKYVCE